MSTYQICPQCPTDMFPVGAASNCDLSIDTNSLKQKLVSKVLEVATPTFFKVFLGKDISYLKLLQDLLDECLEELEGDISQINRKTFVNTLKFLLVLPNDIPLPELQLDSSGDITLEWYYDKWNILSIIVDETNVYHYAGMFGNENNRDFGRRELSNITDKYVLDNIRRITNRL